MLRNNRNILVTGSHRSGSTWVGKVISTSPRMHYIHEPFNIQVYKDDTVFKSWFEYISDQSGDNHEKEKRYINNYLHPDFNSIKKAFENKNFNEIYTKLKIFAKTRLSRQLIKDPIAVFSAEWLAKMFDLNVIVIIRHPAAFSASLKVKNWSFNFNDFLNQDYLMKDYLYPFREEIEAQVKNSGDIIDQAILLWNCIYHVVRIYQEKYFSRWIFVKHEDISMNPVDEYKKLFKQLDLVWDKKVEKYLFQSTRAIPSSEYHLSTKENIFSWKRRLTASEIARVRRGTNEVSEYFYKGGEW